MPRKPKDQNSADSVNESTAENAVSTDSAENNAPETTAPIQRNKLGEKNDPEVSEELAGRTEIMRRKSK